MPLLSGPPGSAPVLLPAGADGCVQHPWVVGCALQPFEPLPGLQEDPFPVYSGHWSFIGCVAEHGLGMCGHAQASCSSRISGLTLAGGPGQPTEGAVAACCH